MIRIKKSIEIWDWLLIIGAILSPMTAWRISKVGPAELLCFVWALKYINFRRQGLNLISRFSVVFMISLLIGSLICISVAPKELTASGLVTWVYLLFIGNSLYSYCKTKPYSYLVAIFDRFCKGAVLWYLGLYLFSLFVGSRFLGAPLWYYNRFRGGGKNPHQIAVLFCGIVFWFASQFLKKKHMFSNIVCFAISIFIESKTLSSTGKAAIAAGIFATVIIITVNRVKSAYKRTVYLILEGLIGVLFIAIFYNKLYNVLYEWVASDRNGLGRFYIWSSFKAAFLKSPIFGLGTGMHAISYSGMKEFHNSYLEILAASGIVGFAAFIAMTVRSIKWIIKGDRTLLPILLSLYMYSMAGFAFRRLAYWIVFVFTIVISMKYYEENNTSLYRQIR